MNEQEFRELSAGHALGALSPDDEQTFAAESDRHSEWTTIVDDDLDTAAVLGDRVQPVPPPPMLREQLLRAVGEHRNLVESSEMSKFTEEEFTQGTSSPEPADPPGSAGAAEFGTPKRNWRRAMFALVASIAVFGGLALGAQTLFRTASPPPAAVVALEQIEAAPDANVATTTFAGGEATVHWSAGVGKVVLVADGLPEIDDERTFELWFVRGETPLPAGTFSATDGVSTALLSGDMQPGDVIAVTIEETGGSPSGLPTTDPVLAISTA